MKYVLAGQVGGAKRVSSSGVCAYAPLIELISTYTLAITCSRSTKQLILKLRCDINDASNQIGHDIAIK